jgi:hypothetical protein
MHIQERPMCAKENSPSLALRKKKRQWRETVVASCVKKVRRLSRAQDVGSIRKIIVDASRISPLHFNEDDLLLMEAQIKSELREEEEECLAAQHEEDESVEMLLESLCLSERALPCPSCSAGYLAESGDAFSCACGFSFRHCGRVTLQDFRKALADAHEKHFKTGCVAIPKYCVKDGDLGPLTCMEVLCQACGAQFGCI